MRFKVETTPTILISAASVKSSWKIAKRMSTPDIQAIPGAPIRLKIQSSTLHKTWVHKSQITFRSKRIQTLAIAPAVILVWRRKERSSRMTC